MINTCSWVYLQGHFHRWLIKGELLWMGEASAHRLGSSGVILSLSPTPLSLPLLCQTLCLVVLPHHSSIATKAANHELKLLRP